VTVVASGVMSPYLVSSRSRRRYRHGALQDTALADNWNTQLALADTIRNPAGLLARSKKS
jgi:hypothetical protein